MFKRFLPADCPTEEVNLFSVQVTYESFYLISKPYNYCTGIGTME